jgi:subfamily B ATP-binding cassette protein MsbA
MVAFGASDGVVPFLGKYALDHVFTKGSTDVLYTFPVILIAISLFRAIADFGQQFLMAKIGHYVVRDIRNDMDNKVLNLGPAFFLRNSSGDILARVNGDVLLVRSLLTDTVAAILRDAIRIVVLIATAIYLDVQLAMIAFVVLPIGIVPILRFGKRIRRLSKRGQDAIGMLGALLNEVVVGSKVIKIFGTEEFEKKRFMEENERLTQTFIKSERVRALTGPVNEILASFAIAGVVLYGGLSVANGVRTQGEFIAFLMATFLLYDPFKKLSRISSTVFLGMAGASRVFELLDAVEDIRTPVSPKSLPRGNTITLEDVSVTYPTKDMPAIEGVSLQIEQGEKVALVGFSGAGKSTLFDLIPRFIDPTQGRVLLGGVDVRELELSALRSRITMVSQHTFLFNDSVLNNIKYGSLHASREQVEQVAADAGAWEFIEQLPFGLDTVIGEGGHSLSGGERQRLAIARAMLKNSPILLLDEATASLDNRAERVVQEAIERLERNRTSLVIAHRLSSIRGVDRIVVMRDGRIVESGTHEFLIALKGEYFSLYSYQFEAQSKTEVSHSLIQSVR